MSSKGKPAAGKRKGSSGTGKWSADETALMKELMKQNPDAEGEDLHHYFPDKKLKAVKAKMQFVRGASFSRICSL